MNARQRAVDIIRYPIKWSHGEPIEWVMSNEDAREIVTYLVEAGLLVTDEPHSRSLTPYERQAFEDAKVFARFEQPVPFVVVNRLRRAIERVTA